MYSDDSDSFYSTILKEQFSLFSKILQKLYLSVQQLEFSNMFLLRKKRGKKKKTFQTLNKSSLGADVLPQHTPTSVCFQLITAGQ